MLRSVEEKHPFLQGKNTLFLDCLDYQTVRLQDFKTIGLYDLTAKKAKGSRRLFQVSTLWLCGFVRLYDLTARNTKKAQGSRRFLNHIRSFKVFFYVLICLIWLKLKLCNFETLQLCNFKFTPKKNRFVINKAV